MRDCERSNPVTTVALMLSGTAAIAAIAPTPHWEAPDASQQRGTEDDGHRVVVWARVHPVGTNLYPQRIEGYSRTAFVDRGETAPPAKERMLGLIEAPGADTPGASFVTTEPLRRIQS